MNIIKTSILLLSTFIAISLISCDNGGEMSEKTVQFPSIKDVPVSSWEHLSQKKIYFGHQSVGNNIIDGIRDLMKENPQIKFNIVETANESDFNVGVFAHSRVGKNVDPKSKIDEFVSFIDKGIGKEADFAALKFCYVDIAAGTNANNVFNDYSDSILQLKKKHPDTTIIHFTVPLTTTKTTWKTWIKKLIGKKTWEYDDNIKRNEYNEMLLKKYEGKEPVLDIAKIESTFPDGTRFSFTKDGKTYYSMVPEYTYDGGHLNEVGRKKVAEQLLILLANLN